MDTLYWIEELLDKFQGYNPNTQWIIGLIGIALIAGLTCVLIVIALNPIGVGAVLAFITAVVALLFGRGKNPPPGQTQTAYRSRW